MDDPLSGRSQQQLSEATRGVLDTHHQQHNLLQDFPSFNGLNPTLAPISLPTPRTQVGIQRKFMEDMQKIQSYADKSGKKFSQELSPNQAAAALNAASDRIKDYRVFHDDGTVEEIFSDSFENDSPDKGPRPTRKEREEKKKEELESFKSDLYHAFVSSLNPGASVNVEIARSKCDSASDLKSLLSTAQHLFALVKASWVSSQFDVQARSFAEAVSGLAILNEKMGRALSTSLQREEVLAERTASLLGKMDSVERSMSGIGEAKVRSTIRSSLRLLRLKVNGDIVGISDKKISEIMICSDLDRLIAFVEALSCAKHQEYTGLIKQFLDGH